MTSTRNDIYKVNDLERKQMHLIEVYSWTEPILA